MRRWCQLTEGRVLSWEHVPDVQPAIVLDEFVECEAACAPTRDGRRRCANAG